MLLLLRLAIFLPLLVSLPQRTFAPGRTWFDRTLLSHAALLFGHSTAHRTVQWVRQQPDVAWAGLGRDGQTVMIRLRNGLQEAVLPSVDHTVRVSTSLPSVATRTAPRTSVAAAAPARALVLEPFATELKLGPQAADPVVADLHEVGFQVDQLYDENVTLNTMYTLPNYDVIYWMTHSGVNQYGEGVVATGQVAPPTEDPAMKPMIDDYAVLAVGVQGTSQSYYGIMSRFITNYIKPLQPHSIWVVAGCELLRATRFWDALQQRGAGALVSWDHQAYPQDEQPAVGALFWALGRGKSVSQAVDDTVAQGYGTSTTWDGPPAHIGFLGDGNERLQDFVPATPTPRPTNTPLPSPTPIPTATRLPVPAPTRTTAKPASQPHLRLGSPRVERSGRLFRLRITVRDQKGRPVSGATVTIDGRSVGMSKVRTHSTGKNGNVEFSSLHIKRSGKIALRATKAGWRAANYHVQVST